jgi:hypothetical protein
MDAVDRGAERGAKRVRRGRDPLRRDEITRLCARGWLLLPQPSDALDVTSVLAQRAES